jgi:hypothetical protein
MVDVAWLREDRTGDPKKYLVAWNDPESRQRAFLGGWTSYLEHGHLETEVLHWRTVGAFYGSVLGNVAEDVRRQLYFACLAEYVKSTRCRHWTDEEREKALALAAEAPGLRQDSTGVK